MKVGDWWSPKQLAGILCISVQVLAAMREEGGGPPFLPIGKRIFYPKEELYKWLEGQVMTQGKIRMVSRRKRIVDSHEK